MPTLFANDARKALNQRLARLRQDAPPRWGRFTAPRMLAHVNDGLRLALGDLPTATKNLPLRYPPLKQLFRGRRDWPLHPAFGRLSSRAWGALGYRQVDHHLTQFGV